MSDAKATPGPWEAIRTSQGNWMVRCCAVDHPENSRPHQPALIWWHEEHAAANAKLLAAAWLLPDLAAALRALVDVETAGVRFESLDWNRRAERFTAHHRAKAALARYEQAMEASDA